MLKQKIAFLCPYFGALPWYFKFFIKSCEKNPNVDFYLITDNHTIENLPINVILVPSSLENIKERISRVLTLSIDFSKAYKLCDFKPTYGLVFQDLLALKEYSFWGHCDIDIVLGKIANFITDEMLNSYDVISVRHDYTPGFFMLYRNEEKTNSLFKKSADYMHVFQSPKNFCFDECSYHHRDLMNGKPLEKVQNYIDAMTFVINRESKRGNIKVLYELFALEGTLGSVTWSDGILTYEDRYEALLYHLITTKNKVEFLPYQYANISNTFTISVTDIHFYEVPKLSNGNVLPRLNKEKYVLDERIQVKFGQYTKSSSGRFRQCGAKA